MNELENLRPEVREAVKNFDDLLGGFGDVREFRWQTIRAELLRLTDDCARLVDCINAQPPTRRRLIDRAERAEAELAALKARIEGSPACSVFTDAKVYCCVPRDWAGKRVRLVVEE